MARYMMRVGRPSTEPTPPFSLSGFIKIVQLTKPRYSLFLLGLVISIGGAILNLIVPKMIAPLVQTFAKGINYPQLATIIACYIGSAILTAIGSSILGFFGEGVVARLRRTIWDKMITLKVAYFAQVKSGEVGSRLVNDTSQVKNFLANTLPSTITSLILIVGSIVMMIRMDWHMTLAMVVVVPIAMMIFIPLGRFGHKIGIKRQDSLAAFSGVASETLSEIRLIKSSNAEQQATRSAKKEMDALYQIGLKEAIYDGIMHPVMMLLMMGMIIGLLAYGVHRVAIGAMEMGTLMSFLMYLMNFMGSISSIALFMTSLSKASGSTARLQELVDEDQENLAQGIDYDLNNQSLKVQNLSFSYDKGQQILNSVSFEANPNQIIAFAGPSGGGKSTIFSLLERFYQPDSGLIQVGDQPVEGISLTSWRRQIGFVSQDSAIMAGSIRDNLTYGLDGDYSDDQLWRVLDLAFAEKFVRDLPDQLDTQVGERGVKLSGGQKQRIAIARAFLRDPKILMLDEATASLDSESESQVQAALDSLMKGRTTLVIAHRLSTIVDANQIYFVEQGRITGQGKHAELVSTHPLYAKYVNEQVLD